MGNKNPSPSTRFPVNRQDHTQKGPYLLPLLKRCLEKKINYEDPETQKMIQGRVKDAVIWRLILNATQGDNYAIKEILERIDGKVPQELMGEGFGDTKIIVVREKEKASGQENNIRRAIPAIVPE